MIKKGLQILLLTAFLFAGVFAAAESPYRRLVDFEWEEIEGARAYEVELKQEKDEGKTFNFKMKTAKWNGRLAPGQYKMRLRSFDYRNVPGEWSEPSNFNVGLDIVQLQYPGQDSKVPTQEEDKINQKFKWKPVGGAEKYNFTLSSEDGKTQISETLEKTEFDSTLPVANNYTWKVTAISPEGIESEAVSVGNFSLLGKPLPEPKIEKPESEFVRELKWTRPEKATSFDVFVLKLNPEAKKYQIVQTYENYTQDSLPFDDNWPGGRYQLVVRSKSDLRPQSKTIKESFTVRSGDRSPAAEYTALVRKSIEKVSGWYAIASYLITQMQFRGSNPEKNSVTNYNALGGTGRLGMGWFDPKRSWGFLGVLDMSGFTLNGATQTFASAEANAVYRTATSDRAEWRLQAGAFFKELPETIGDPFSGTSEGLKISSAGPHVGAEYWYSLTPKIGIQFNAHAYMSVLKMSTPNGEDIVPSLSTQFGFLGSYRFTPTFTGLIGYARREDRVSYNAAQGVSSFADSGDINESTIIGNYLNVFAEWSF